MVRITKTNLNKKGVSMLELIAYLALYGAIISLLGSLTFTIILTARKVNRQAILNRGATIMYTDILSGTISLNPDTINDVIYEDASGNVLSVQEKKEADGIHVYVDNVKDATSRINSISIKFVKKYTYNDDGTRSTVTNPESITYKYIKGQSNIIVIRNDDNLNPSTINLEYNLRLTSSNSDDIYNVISVSKQNTSDRYVTFHGNLHFDERTQEFNFIVPIFVAGDQETTSSTTNP